MSANSEVEAIIAETQARLHELADLAATGDISTADFVLQMRQEIKNAYVEEYLLATGEKEMSSSDWGLLGSLVKDQYNYLGGFADDVQTGHLSADQITARMDMYIYSSRSAYEAALQGIAFGEGADEEHWVCAEDERSCADCANYDSQGWVPLGDLPNPGDGESQCLTNCRCHKEYRKSEELQQTQDYLQSVEEGA